MPEKRTSPDLLHDLSEKIGGKNFDIGNLAELPDVAAKIGLEL
jgi:hypothetical protein